MGTNENENENKKYGKMDTSIPIMGIMGIGCLYYFIGKKLNHRFIDYLYAISTFRPFPFKKVNYVLLSI